jgi:hypothetical protein
VPEALARSHNDSILSRSARGASRKDRRGFAQTVVRRLLSRPARTVAGATLAAILTGIVINALVMQKEHRAAPLFGAPRPPTEISQPPAAPAPATAQGAPVAAQPPVRPAGLGAASDAAPIPPSRADDPIRDLLRGDAGKDPAHLTIAAQNALIKLGFAIKADGVVGASTEQAIQQFERAHGVAPSSEITPRIVKLLSAAANAAAR